MLAIRPAPDSHEDLILVRYDRMLAWAIRIAGNDRVAGEDLVHDAFVRFLLTRPPLDTIENLDGYLHTMLRNLYLSRLRRRETVRARYESLLDFESTEAVLHLVRSRDLLRARRSF